MQIVIKLTKTAKSNDVIAALRDIGVVKLVSTDRSIIGKIETPDLVSQIGSIEGVETVRSTGL